jgi:hypothetical protein
MDYMTKRSTRYKTLVAQGVTAHALRCEHGCSGLWRVEFTHLSTITREKAKECAQEYLWLEFEAYGVSFFVAKTGKPHAFFARFHTNAL